MRWFGYFTLCVLVAGCVGSATKDALTDADGDGFPIGEDCDDGNSDVYPGALEVCDNQDNDCDGTIDQGASDANVYYADADDDGYGDAEAVTTACSVPPKHVENDGDCDDTSPFINPSAKEVCDADGIDEDCDGYADDDDDGTDFESKTAWFRDRDWDGYGGVDADALYRCADPSDESARFSTENTDCDDGRSDVNPGAQEVCDTDETDEDCDGRIDDLDEDVDVTTKIRYYRDADDDGYGDLDDEGTLYCDYPSVGANEYALNNVDCNDADALIHPGRLEVCDALNVDENCNGVADDADSGTIASTKNRYFADVDEDSFGDMDDPGTALCDDPSTSTSFYVTDSSDCDDSRADISPGASEVCDADDIDEDCDGVSDDGDSSVLSTSKTLFFIDVDKDGYGDVSRSGTLYCNDPSTSALRYSLLHTDCDDGDATIHPGAVEVCDTKGVDEDCDGLTNDNDPSVDTAGMVTTYPDADGDGYGAQGATGTLYCTTPPNTSLANSDCDDSRSDISPAETEVCDADDIDEDCNGVADDFDSGVDATTQSRFYADSDGDGFGAPGSGGAYCDDPSTTTAAFVANDLDCDDGDAAVSPTADEVCDAANVDEDCDGSSDDADASVLGTTKTTFYLDADGDGYGDAAKKAIYCDVPSGSASYVVNALDCNDLNAAVSPAEVERCDVANTDEDCDGLVDDADSSATGKTAYYPDTDGDGFGDSSATSTPFCDAPAAYVVDNTDCDDDAENTYPGAIEVCDSSDTDEDCDGVADDDDTSALASTKRVFYPDNDKDGYGSVAATGALYCDNPTTAAVSFTLDQSDCNDANSAINPSATEVCDAGNIDEDCNGLADDNDPYTVATGKQRFYADRDWDGYGDETDVGLLRCDSPSSGSMVYVTDNSDCDDASSRVNPGQVEQCDPSDVDEDCNGVADDDDTSVASSGKTSYYMDIDKDSFGDAATAALRFCDDPSTSAVWYSLDDSDCDDSDAFVSPGALEICDVADVDEDCDGVSDDDDISVSNSSKTSFYRDADGDGFGDVSLRVYACDDPSGAVSYVTNATDCNDANAAISPAASEQCDPSNLDEDCDGRADDADTGGALRKVRHYLDIDGDGYGDDADAGRLFCDAPTGLATTNSDCDDDDAQTKPGVPERFDFKDSNCDGVGDQYDLLNILVDADTVVGDTSGVRAGSALSALGDVDGDGLDDFFVGAEPSPSNGEVYLYRGSSSVVPSSASGDSDVTIQLPSASTAFGTVVSALGDINGDGYDDVAVSDAGADTVWLIHGGTAYGTSCGSTSSSPKYCSLFELAGGGGINLADEFHVKIKGGTGTSFGASVAPAGDVNGDGYDDFVIGAPDAQSLGMSGANGEAYLYLGGCHTLTTPSTMCGSGGLSGIYFGGLNAEGAASRTEADARLVLTGEYAGDGAGEALSGGGDLNGDGYDDVIVGAPYVLNAGGVQVGGAYLVFGGQSNSSSPSGMFGLSSAGQLDLGDALRIDGEADGLQFGESVAVVGDLNDDGYSDIVIGDSYYGRSGTTRAAKGRVYVFLGGCDAVASCATLTGVFADFVAGVAPAFDADVRITGGFDNDWLGRSVASAGDLNNDGYTDLILGAPGVDVSGATNVGSTYLLLGGCDGTLCSNRESGLFKSRDASLLMDASDSGASIMGPSAYNGLGESVCGIGDFNGDGYDDVGAGAPDANYFILLPGR